MNEFHIEITALVITKIAKMSTSRLMRTHPDELLEYLSKNGVFGAEEQTDNLLMAAITFILKITEMKKDNFDPEEIDDVLTEFLLEFIAKRK